MPERADAILFNSSASFLIETKISRSDFLADAKKEFRKSPDKGIGIYRYYACPAGLIKPDELPPKWGLIYVYEGRKRAAMPAGYGAQIKTGEVRAPTGQWLSSTYELFGSRCPDLPDDAGYKHVTWAREAFRFDERCPHLEIRYLYALCTRYRDKKFMATML